MRVAVSSSFDAVSCSTLQRGPASRPAGASGVTRSTWPPAQWSNKDSHFAAAINDPWYKLIFGLTAEIYYATSEFYRREGFAPGLTPVTCSSISSPMGLGSDSLPVKIELFGRPTYLADSMQFQLEYLLRLGGPGVFYIMSTFRGEDPSKRHLNQFFHSEAEMVGGLEDVMRLVERYVRFCTTAILENLGPYLRGCGIGTEHLEKVVARADAFPTITFAEARALLAEDPFCVTKLADDLWAISHLGERVLMEKLRAPLWMTHPPSRSVPFYQASRAAPGGEKEALCADLFMGIGEVVGCGERHQTARETLESLQDHEVDPSDYDWYLRMKREYPIRTAGFGLGIERYLLWVLKHDDIRDIPLLPRLKYVENMP